MLVRQLAARADAEAKAMTTSLSRNAIASRRRTRCRPKFSFSLNSPKKFASLKPIAVIGRSDCDEIETEIDEEPERIRRTYDVTAERLEPIGLAYLWPVTG